MTVTGLPVLAIAWIYPYGLGSARNVADACRRPAIHRLAVAVAAPLPRHRSRRATGSGRSELYRAQICPGRTLVAESLRGNPPNQANHRRALAAMEADGNCLWRAGAVLCRCNLVSHTPEPGNFPLERARSAREPTFDVLKAVQGAWGWRADARQSCQDNPQTISLSPDGKILSVDYAKSYWDRRHFEYAVVSSSIERTGAAIIEFAPVQQVCPADDDNHFPGSQYISADAERSAVGDTRSDRALPE